MNKNLWALFIVVSAMSTAAYARLTIFPNSEVITHVLRSPELAGVQSTGQPLAGLEIVSVSVNSTAHVGAGRVYDLTMHFRGGNRNCHLTARVRTVRVDQGNIAANRLGAPALSTIRCAD